MDMDTNTNTTTRPNKPHWMLFLTQIAFITGCIAFSHNFYIIALAEWLLVLSSIIYWMKPSCEFRRKIDIIIVQFSLYTHIFYSILCNSSMAICCYLIGMISYAIGLNKDSNIMHALVWIFGCIGNYKLIIDLAANMIPNILNNMMPMLVDVVIL
jgi:hypothetical protein